MKHWGTVSGDLITLEREKGRERKKREVVKERMYVKGNMLCTVTCLITYSSTALSWLSSLMYKPASSKTAFSNVWSSLMDRSRACFAWNLEVILLGE